MQEIIVSVRKCVPDVRVELCVKVLAEDFSTEAWEKAVGRVVAEQERHFGDRVVVVGGGGAGGPADQEDGMEGVEAKVVRLRRVENYVELYGVLIKLETDGT